MVISMDIMDRFNARGYFVRENVFIYYTEDMDQTLQWFEDVLGWYGKVIDRLEDGTGTYGFVTDMPHELAMAQAIPFKGIHLWNGEPVEKTVALIQVSDIEKLHGYVKKQGWNQIGEIHSTGASPKTCDVTTIDNCVLSFFQ